jgi:uncharacterized protein with HEPN domain
VPPRDPLLRLRDMLEACRRIDRFTAGLSFEDFAADEKTVDATLRNLIVIGEAASHVPEELAATYSALPWAEMRGMRNIVIHEYFGVSLAIIWQTVVGDIASLRSDLERILGDELKA